MSSSVHRAITAAGQAGPSPCCQLSAHHCVSQAAPSSGWEHAWQRQRDFSWLLPQGPASGLKVTYSSLRNSAFERTGKSPSHAV